MNDLDPIVKLDQDLKQVSDLDSAINTYLAWLVATIGHVNAALWLINSRDELEHSCSMKYNVVHEDPLIDFFRGTLIESLLAQQASYVYLEAEDAREITVQFGVPDLTEHDILTMSLVCGLRLMGVVVVHRGSILGQTFDQTTLLVLLKSTTVFAQVLLEFEQRAKDQKPPPSKPSEKKKERRQGKKRSEWWKRGEPPPF